jgi:hypothetical protein
VKKQSMMSLHTKQKSSYIINSRNSTLLHRDKKTAKTNVIPVNSTMENFKEATYLIRRPSCPLIVMDKIKGKF